MPFLSLLTGPLGKWVGIGLVVGLLGLGIYVQTLRLTAAQEAMGRYKDAAEANAAVVKRLQDDAVLERKIVVDQAAALARLQNARDTIVKEVIRAPTTTACVDSPAIRAALTGMRQWTDNPPANGGASSAGQPGAPVR